MPYTSVFAEEEEATTGGVYRSVFSDPDKSDETPNAPTPQERLRRFQERFPGATPGLDPKVAPGEPPAVERQGLVERAGDYQKARVRSLIDSWQSGLWDLTQIPKTVAELDLAAKKLVLPEGLEPFAEAQNRPGIEALDRMQPEWLRERADASRAEMEASKQAKAEAGLALGLPDAAQVAENFAEDALSMAADPIELLPGGAAARGVRSLSRGRGAAKAAPDLATALRRGGVLAPDAPTPRPGDVWFDPARGESYEVVETAPDAMRVQWESGKTEEIFEAQGRSHRILEPAPKAGSAPEDPRLDVDTGSPEISLKGMGNAISENLYQGVWDRLESGRAPSPFKVQPAAEQRVWDAYKRGEVQGVEDVRRIMSETGKPGEAGFLRVGKEPFQPKDPSQPRPPGISPLRRWFSSEGEFEPAGDLRSTFTRLREQATGETKADLWRAERNWRLVERELKKSSADREKASAAVIEYLEAPEDARPALAAQLPENVVEPLEKMRAHTADLQLRAIGTPGLLSEEMSEIYGSRVGQHLTRGYEAFINPSYLDDVRGTKLWDETFDWLRSEPSRLRSEVEEVEKMRAAGEATGEQLRAAKKSERAMRWIDQAPDSEVEGWMEEFVSRGPQMFRPASRGEVAGKKGSLGAYRQDLPDQLQRLLGRMDDPEYRYKRTVQRLAPDIAEQQMLNEMQSLGEGKLFFDKPIAGFSAKIPGTTTKDPLGGKYTTKPMAEVIAGFRGIRSKEPNLVDWFTDQYLRANGLVKTGMTAYSPTTHIRNSGSWGLLGLATGHGIAPVRRAMQAVRALRETGDTGKLLSQLGIESKGKFENLWEEALRLGVTGQSVHVGHLEDYARWVRRARTDRGKRSVRGALAKPFDVTANFAETAYALEDDLPKFSLWLEEMKLYRKAMPGASDDEILRLAARNIRNITPTWDKVPRGVREISRFPFFGMFPGFQAEMVRNTKNLLKLSADEIRSKNPRLRKVGAKRIAGLLASLSIPEAAAIAGGAALSGVSMKGQTQDVMRRREFQPEWQKNSSMLYWPAEGEDFRQLDVGFLDPRAGMKRPIMAAVAGILQEQAGVPTALGRGALQFGEAFLGTEAGVRAAAEAVQNRDERGMPIANPQSGLGEQVAERVLHIANEVAPGVYRGGRNVAKSLEGERWATGRQRKPWQEMLGAYGGVRISDTNVAQSAPYYAWELGEQRQNVRRLFTEKIRSDLRSDAAQIRPETIQEGVAEAQEAWAKVWEDASRKLEAFKGEGIPQAVAFLDALDSEGGWREGDLLDLVEGNPPPPVVHPEDLKRIVEDQMRLYRFDPELSGARQ